MRKLLGAEREAEEKWVPCDDMCVSLEDMRVKDGFSGVALC